MTKSKKTTLKQFSFLNLYFKKPSCKLGLLKQLNQSTIKKTFYFEIIIESREVAKNAQEIPVCPSLSCP